MCFARGITGAGERGDQAFAAAAVLQERRMLASAVVGGGAGAPYSPALLALREGRLLEAAVRALGDRQPRRPWPSLPGDGKRRVPPDGR